MNLGIKPEKFKILTLKKKHNSTKMNKTFYNVISKTKPKIKLKKKIKLDIIIARLKTAFTVNKC